jgi:hypothetical protein
VPVYKTYNAFVDVFIPDGEMAVLSSNISYLLSLQGTSTSI